MRKNVGIKEQIYMGMRNHNSSLFERDFNENVMIIEPYRYVILKRKAK